MEPSDLAFFPTADLIGELMARKTFLGVVIQAADDLREDQWSGDKVFKVHTNSNLGMEQASRLLHTISDYIERHAT